MEITRFKGIAVALVGKTAAKPLFKTGIVGIEPVKDFTPEEEQRVVRWMSGYAKHTSDAKPAKATKRSKRGRRSAAK